MSPDKLVRMANQIATFFRAQPGTDAAAQVADHLRQFWEPRMRNAILAHDGTGLDPIAASAVEMLRRGAAPDPAKGSALGTRQGR